MTMLHCAHCGRETEFLPIYRAIRIVDVDAQPDPKELAVRQASDHRSRAASLCLDMK
jgi:hypothetical protein